MAIQTINQQQIYQGSASRKGPRRNVEASVAKAQLAFGEWKRPLPATSFTIA